MTPYQAILANPVKHAAHLARNKAWAKANPDKVRVVRRRYERKEAVRLKLNAKKAIAYEAQRGHVGWDIHRPKQYEGDLPGYLRWQVGWMLAQVRAGEAPTYARMLEAICGEGVMEAYPPDQLIGFIVPLEAFDLRDHRQLRQALDQTNLTGQTRDEALRDRPPVRRLSQEELAPLPCEETEDAIFAAQAFIRAAEARCCVPNSKRPLLPFHREPTVVAQV